MNLQSLIEQMLAEDAALTKGSQRVMNDKKLVINLADAIRDDARSHPSAFPAGSNRSFQKTPDEQLAKWFLENIDNIEQGGYEGTIYSRDGVNSDWIVRRYITGSHNWEDLTGVMNMNLRDWYLLKNRNMLDINHKDLPKFNSVRDVGYYMTTHYKDALEVVRDAAVNAARNKLAKSVKLVDNDDYRIYTTLNRAAGCALGLGTQWCTANSKSSTHYDRYSDAAMLFQLFPYKKEKDEDGKKGLNDAEKYQFDGAGPNFMDITDHPANPGVVREKFPYLYTDLSSALKEKKPALEKAFEELSNDPSLQHADFKIKTYEIDDEIKKLHKFVDRGYFTDESRPKSKIAPVDASQEQPQLAPAAEKTPQENPMEDMFENISILARYMIEDNELDEDDEETDAATAATGGDTGSMGTGAGPIGGEKYSSGTAPTMPESLNYKGKEIMENVDKDVAAMLTSLKKYDMLTESVAPVLGMKTLGEKANADDPKGPDYEDPAWVRAKKKERENKKQKDGIDESDDSDDKNPWEKLASDKKDDKKPDEKSKTHKGGDVTKTDKGLVHKGTYGGDDKKDKVAESADEEILEWMKRFASLGNMKGYGR